MALQTEAGREERLGTPILKPLQATMPYWLALGVTAALLVLHAALQPWLQDRAPFLIFLPAVLLAGGLGGFGPGLLATALGLGLGVYFVGGMGGITNPQLIEAALFALVGVGAAWFGEQLRRARIRDRGECPRALRPRGAFALDPRYRP